ncbi:MAG: SCO family protein [Rhodocyclales bacterium]|nr:SCO family protein [Rhodocyclales bacterium]
MRPLRASAFCLALCWTLGWAVSAGGQTVAAPKHSDEPAGAADLAPRYLLQDHRGRAVTQEDFPDRFQLIIFGFTSCPDVCPTTLLNFKNILQAMGNKAGRLQPIFITVDPERDTASMLKEYTAAFDPRIIGLTGSPELIRRAADTFRVTYQKVREPGAAPDIYTMDHSTGMYLLDPDGRFVVKFASNAPAKDVAARIRKLMDADHSRPPSSRRGNAPLR